MRPNVSVCMATYNGAMYLTPQIDSILAQFGEFDELIIVDDCSTDNTISVIKSYYDERIKLFINRFNRGHVKTFERALGLASKEIILLSDQDDIWIPGRLDCLVEELLNSECDLASSNMSLIDDKGDKLPNLKYCLLKNDSDSVAANVIGIFLGRKPYYGCAMALRSRMLALALPIPSFVESHDIWLALVANLTHRNCHMEAPTLMRRVHSHNLTPLKRRPISKVLITRLTFLLYVLIIFRRQLGLINGKTRNHV